MPIRPMIEQLEKIASRQESAESGEMTEVPTVVRKNDEFSQGIQENVETVSEIKIH